MKALKNALDNVSKKSDISPASPSPPSTSGVPLDDTPETPSPPAPPPIPDDCYIAEGLIYCSRCRSPRQVRVGENTFGCLCRCQALVRNAQMQLAKEKTRRLAVADELERLARLSLIVPTQPDATFDSDDAHNLIATTAAINYVDHFDNFAADGQGLLFYGGTGTGKTFLAQCIVNALVAEGRFAALSSFRRIESALWNSDDRQTLLDTLTHFDLLALDDLFAERDTPYMAEKIFAIVDTLTHARVCMVITTNLTAAQLAEKGNIERQRILSRLYECCHFMEIGGEDRRVIKSRQNKRAFPDKLLGTKPQNKENF